MVIVTTLKIILIAFELDGLTITPEFTFSVFYSTFIIWASLGFSGIEFTFPDFWSSSGKINVSPFLFPLLIL